MENPARAAPAVLAIFALTYLGIALGHVPGLKLNRTGIALLGAIAIMIFSGLPTTSVIGFINWPTDPALVRFFCPVGATAACPVFSIWWPTPFRRPARTTRAVSSQPDAGDGGAVSLSQSRHRLFCFRAGRGDRADPPADQSGSVSHCVGAREQHRCGRHLVGNPQDMMIAQVAGLSFGPYVLWCIAPVLFALALRLRAHLGDVPSPPDVLCAGARAMGSIYAQPFNRASHDQGVGHFGVGHRFLLHAIPKEIIALTAAAIHLASPKFRTKTCSRLVDWSILVLFMGLFVVTGAFQATGYSDQLVQWLAHAGLNLQSPSILAIVTAVLSNLINNSAAALLLVKSSMSLIRRRPTCWHWPIALAAASSSSAASPTSSSCNKRANLGSGFPSATSPASACP